MLKSILILKCLFFHCKVNIDLYPYIGFIYYQNKIILVDKFVFKK